MAAWRRLKHYLTANFLDAPRYEVHLRWPRLAGWFGRSWIDLANRGERLLRHPDQRGVKCDWRWTSALFFCQARPTVGRALLERALADWPILFRDAPCHDPARTPKVSFIIGHRGTARVPHLLATLASVAAQEGPAVEAVVVEQAAEPALDGFLPAWVQRVHTPPPRPDMPYSRSWAFNVGARHARGRYLVFHDNDVCAPARYAAELVRLFQAGYEAARLQRFVFHLCEAHTGEVFDGRPVLPGRPPEYVMQNCEGHTLAVEREAYFDLGGHDEAFLGWGGEDNEIFDRCRTRRLHDHAYLPFVHLHHAPQPGKAAAFPNRDYFDRRMQVPAPRRVAELAARPIGMPEGPNLSYLEQSRHGA